MYNNKYKHKLTAKYKDVEIIVTTSDDDLVRSQMNIYFDMFTKENFVEKRVKPAVQQESKPEPKPELTKAVYEKLPEPAVEPVIEPAIKPEPIPEPPTEPILEQEITVEPEVPEMIQEIEAAPVEEELTALEQEIYEEDKPQKDFSPELFPTEPKIEPQIEPKVEPALELKPEPSEFEEEKGETPFTATTISELQKQEEPPVQQDFETILEEKIAEPAVTQKDKIETSSVFADFLNSKKSKNQLDDLIITAYYLGTIEHEERFTLKKINHHLYAAKNEIVDHNAIIQALKEELIMIMPDLTGISEITEYALTVKGEDYFRNEL